MVQPTTMQEDAELARSARECPALRRAAALAGWFGSGRDLSPDGRLRSEDVTELTGLLDINAEGFQDSDEFYLAFSAADAAGFLEFSDDFDRAWQSVKATSWPTADDAVVLTWWQETLFEVAGIEMEGENLSADTDGLAAVLVLQLLVQADGAVGLAEIQAAADQARQELAEDPEAGDGRAEADGDPGGNEERPSSFDLLVGFGAVRHAGDGGSLTALGYWLARRIGDLVAGGAIRPDDEVPDVIERLITVPEDAALQLAQPWLHARRPVDAARLLLTYAAATDPFRRMITLMLARGIGVEAAPAWQEWAERPGMGAYARIWLDEIDPPAQTLRLREEDSDWITVDVCASALSTAPDQATARKFLSEQGVLAAGAGLLERIDGTDHPNAADVKEFLRSYP